MLKKLSILIMNKLNTVNMFWDNNKQYDISNTMYMQFDDV